jgi:hypothetical protein
LIEFAKLGLNLNGLVTKERAAVKMLFGLTCIAFQPSVSTG